MPRIIVITGTDTNAGKTVLTALLGRHLVASGHTVAALKPICSGGREDARALGAACGNVLSLDEVNPWHFRAPVAPLLAARKQGVTVRLKDVVAHLRQVAHSFQIVLVEGAGGLLSPLGEHFSTRELIAALGADVIIAARNQLGVVNHVRLTLEALPPLPRTLARIALMSPQKMDIAARDNAALLAEFTAPEKVVTLPWLRNPEKLEQTSESKVLLRALSALVR